jgi:hypothetical protein
MGICPEIHPQDSIRLFSVLNRVSAMQYVFENKTVIRNRIAWVNFGL